MGDLNRAIDKLEILHQQWQDNPSPVWGISTGFPSIDNYTGGFQPGEMMVLGARTSHGKTALATQMMFHVLEEILVDSLEAGEPTGQVIAFSPEMADYMLMMRQASVMSRVPSTAIRRAEANPDEVEAFKLALGLLRDYDPYVSLYSQGDLSAQEVRTKVESRHTSKIPIKLVVVDYLQYLTSFAGKDNSYEQTSSIAKEMKKMANDLDIPVLVLSQVNRRGAQSADSEAEDVPELHELEGSGKIEARADTVLLLWRPNNLSEETGMEAQKALVRIGKNRNGPVGIAPLFYYPAITLFQDPLAVE